MKVIDDTSVAQSIYQAAIPITNTITVEKGLAAHFKQPTGPSRPGLDWAVRISGERAGTVIVRTYFSSDPPQEAENPALADRAASLVRRRLEQGWRPEPGSFLEVAAVAEASVATPKKPWWRFW
jgi:hypothetical protein